jgi:hypothetical protein
MAPPRVVARWCPRSRAGCAVAARSREPLGIAVRSSRCVREKNVLGARYADHWRHGLVIRGRPFGGVPFTGSGWWQTPTLAHWLLCEVISASGTEAA